MNETIKEFGKYTLSYNKINHGTSEVIYHIQFLYEQPRIDELESICESIDFLYQSRITIKENLVIYSGYTD